MADNNSTTPTQAAILPDAAGQLPPTQSIPPIDNQGQNVNVFNPEGTLVSIPIHQLQDAMAIGYKQATPQDLQHYADTQKYGTPGQMAITAAEGAGQGIAGPIAPAAEEALFGVDPEAIRKRAEINPATHYGSQMAGLAGSMLVGTGEGAMIAKAGELGAGALGLGKVASTGAKIGSAAVRSAIENMLLQSSDEATKIVTQDPNITAQSAVANIGLSGLLGGAAGAALGSVSPLWKATVGSKVAGLLDALHTKIGSENAPMTDAIEKAIQLSGMDVAPEVKAALSTNPEVKQAFQSLQESTTGAGLKAQEALKNFRSQIADSIVTSLGKTPEEVSAMGLSEYEAGQNIKNSLINSLKSTIEPLSDRFTAIKNKYSQESLTPEAVDQLAHRIGEIAQAEGYSLSPSSPQGALIQRVLKEIPNLKTLEDLRKYQSIIGDSTFANPELRRIGGQLKGAFRNLEDETAMSAAGRISPDSIHEHAQARLAYKNAMDIIDQLNDRLHVGKYAGPGTFINALKEMAPEDILRRLSPKGDAELIGHLNTHFPEAAAGVKDYHISQMLSKAAMKAGEGQTISPAAFFTQLEKTSPEMKGFLMGHETQSKLNAIQQLVEGLPAKMNTSGTAKTLDSLWKHVPGSALGLATMLAGHNPAVGILVGAVTKLMSRDVPDAVKLSLLKFLGSAKPIESEGFASMVDFIDHSIKGDNLMSRATKNVFRSGADVLPTSQIPSDKDLSKLDKQLKGLQTDQKPLFGVGGATGHYMPEHGSALGQTAANAANKLNSARPSTSRANPFDSLIKPSAEQQAAYKRMLGIAQQPLSVLDKVKKGTVTPSDVQSVQSLYPSLYAKMQQKLMDQVMEISNRGETIPYATRLGLSLFLQHPLDSTMLPASILSAQPSQSHQQDRNTASKPPTNGQSKALDKMPAMYETPMQQHLNRKQK